MMFCSCGHDAPLPEGGPGDGVGRYTCTVCGKVLELMWFAGRGALNKWEKWQIRQAQTGEPLPERPRIEFVPAEN